jgi:hypothetical protein
MVSNATFNTISVLSCGQKTSGRGVPQYVIKFVHGREKIIHTRLGLGLSSLNELVFKYNLPLNKFCEQCTGNHTEATEHYIYILMFVGISLLSVSLLEHFLRLGTNLADKMSLGRLCQSLIVTGEKL